MNMTNAYNTQMAAAVNSNVAVDRMETRLSEMMGENRKSRKEIDAVAQDFEAVFLTQMIKHMYEGIEVDDNWGGGSAEETFRTLLFDEYGKAFARSGGVGIADSIRADMLKAQEV